MRDHFHIAASWLAKAGSVLVILVAVVISLIVTHYGNATPETALTSRLFAGGFLFLSFLFVRSVWR